MLKTLATAAVALTLLAAPVLSGVVSAPAQAATAHSLKGKAHKHVKHVKHVKAVKPVKHARHGHRHHVVKQVRHHRHMHVVKQTARTN